MKAFRRVAASAVALSVAGAAWLAPGTTAGAAQQDLIISEYIEGSANNKGLELYNGTSSAIDLSQYEVELYANGATSPTASMPLEGELPADEVHVVAHAQASFADMADQVNSQVINWNGNDAFTLVKDDEVVDSFGQVGNSADFAKDVTLVRKADVTEGDTIVDDAFDPSVEWISHPRDTFDFLGSHEPDDGTDPGPDPGSCDVETIAIGEVQGSGDSTDMAGERVTVQGTVVGDFQQGGFAGYYVQDAGDDDDATSDGIFVYDPQPRAGDVAVGDVLSVTGNVSEHFEMTQISAQSVVACPDSDLEMPEPTAIDFPNTEFERFEGMLVTFDEPLTVLETYEFGRYGQVAVGPERQFTPTALHAPDSEEAQALYEENLANRVLIDDGRGNQNPTPAIHPATQEPLTMDTLFSGGDQFDGVTGVLDYRFDNWAVQPTASAEHLAVTERPAVPEVGGDMTVASFNVLNYFTTLGSRGATSEEELDRQQAKIVAALNEAGPAIAGLNEIENNETAVQHLVDALNEASEPGKWAALVTEEIGTDEITTAFIYQPAIVELEGDYDYITSEDDPRYDDSANRPTLAQTFTHVASGENLTVTVSHMKSKGSECGDPSEADQGHLVGNCNETREDAVRALTDWLNDGAADVAESENIIMLGDFNSYDHEGPVELVEEAGFTDLTKAFGGDEMYSYVFDGQLGYLDYAFANEALEELVVGAEPWQINSDEIPLIDYTLQYKQPAEQALYAPDAYRSSDHDPVIVGIDFDGAEPVVVTAASAGIRLVGQETNLWGTANVPDGTQIHAQHLTNGTWETITTGEVTNGRYTLPLNTINTRGEHQLRALTGDTASETVTLTRINPTTAAHTTTKPVGQTTNVWGTVDGTATIATQVQIGDRWVTSQTRQATGGYNLPLTYGTNQPGRYTYRLQIQHTNGPTEYSTPWTLTRTPAITAASAATKPVGQPTYVWGTTTANTRVWTEVQTSRGWTRSQHTTTNTDGGYRIELTYGRNTPGTTTWRVTTTNPDGTTHHSRTFTLTRS